MWLHPFLHYLTGSTLTPPTLAIMEADPTPAFLTVVGISSDIHIHSIENDDETQKLK
jgi:hypothetical protein